MILLRNYLFNIKPNGHIESGTYRILDIFQDHQVCIFMTHGKTSKPILIHLDVLVCFFLEKKAQLVDDLLPPEILDNDARISEANLKRRKENYDCIKALVEDQSFLRNYASHKKSDLVTNHAKSICVSPLKVTRNLVKYWTNGQVLNALLNFTSNLGGPGKQKSYSSLQRGRPIKRGVYGLIKKQSVNVTNEDKAHIAAEIRRLLKEEEKFTYTNAYDNFKRSYYFDEIESAALNGRPCELPTIKQFKYWAKKFITQEDMIKKRLSNSNWEKDHVGYNSSVSDKITAPGMRYELDATIADVYIVSEFDRNLVLGRPTLYAVVDTASRMIVGIHISMEYASWQAARQAIFNACMSKIKYCSRYGISITHEEWPCVGTPARILCDRGEMIGRNPEMLVSKLGLGLEFTPPYRGDCKGIVERRFGIANEVIHFLPGTTLGELRKRGEKDKRLKAAITIDAFTKIMIKLVLEHNNSRAFEDILTQDLVKANVHPTPLNYWNLYTQRSQHSLQVVSENNFIAHLMKSGSATVLENGIIFEGRRYSCQKAELENWSTKALNVKSWSLDVRHDESWSTDIYIREDHSNQYLKCTLLSADKLYRNLHSAEIIYLNEWKKSKEELPYLSFEKAKRQNFTEEIIKSEIEETTKIKRNETKSSLKDIKINRANYLENKKDEKSKIFSEQSQKISPLSDLRRQANITLLRKSLKKDESDV